jgi:predicted lysophospholipase L1 biosynthesis ABC-type transport system permease subunit
VSREDAQEDLDGLLADLEERFPQGNAAPILARAGFAPLVHRLQDDVVGQVRDFLWVLMGAVGFVLLIACANVANLLIVRGEGRRREMAVAASLGATPEALLRTVLVESSWLGAAGGAVGLGLAAGALRLLHHLQPGNLPRLAQVTLDGRVLLFTLVVSMVTSLLFGLIPALRASRIENLASELRGGGRSMTTGRSGRHSRRWLVGVQIALVLGTSASWPARASSAFSKPH